MTEKEKILYISNVDMAGKFIPGVIEKIRGQAGAFRRAGFSLDILYPTNEGNIIIEKEDGSRSVYKGARPFYTNKGLLSKLLLHLRLAWFGPINFSYCGKDIMAAGYKGVYLRFYLPGQGLINFLKKLRSGNKNIILLLEYPTLNVKQVLKGDITRRVSYFINQQRIRTLNRLSDYIVTLTRDRKLFGKPALFMPNGLDVSKISVLPVPAFEDPIILLGVASDCAHYHGYDKIIKGLHLYKNSGNRPGVRFIIVSSLLGHNISNLRRMAAEYNLQNEVEFLDSMNRQELEAQYKKVHLGVGTLALHRVGLMDNYSLKHREYAAFGLPFVMSRGDEIFEKSPYVMTVERDEEPLDIKKLVSFYLRIRQTDLNYTAAFRKSTEQLIIWDAQLNEVFEVFKKGKLS